MMPSSAGSLHVGALLLGDSRFPAGGHAHSGGAEPAVTAQTVTGLGSLELFLRGRLRTAGLVAAALTAAACARARGTPEGAVAPVRDDYWELLDAEADARTPAPAQREASRRQGRALLRAARVAWPDAPCLAVLAVPASVARPEYRGGPGYRGGPHHAVVLGAAAAAAGCTPGEAARIAAYQAVAGPASSVVRLLGPRPDAGHRGARQARGRHRGDRGQGLPPTRTARRMNCPARPRGPLTCWRKRISPSGGAAL